MSEQVPVILIINAGSSNVKFALYQMPELNKIHSATCETIYDVFNWFDLVDEKYILQGVGHRVVFGGDKFIQPTLVIDEILKDLKKLIPLMPLHLPHNLEAIEYLKKMYPKVSQVACFDTAFHATQLPLAKMFALPDEFAKDGVQHYGFHGLSYEYIADVLPKQFGVVDDERVIVAHLGNGSSMCAMQGGKSLATTMGFSALEGLMMGTRCGRIDPGVLLYLLQEKKYSVESLQELLYKKSGLLGVSGISNDVRELLQSSDPAAKLALDLFCYRAATELSGLLVALNGCDWLVFTGGIGENSVPIRQDVCNWLKWLGVKLDTNANSKTQQLISSNLSKIKVAVIQANEEIIIAQHALNILLNSRK